MISLRTYKRSLVNRAIENVHHVHLQVGNLETMPRLVRLDAFGPKATVAQT